MSNNLYSPQDFPTFTPASRTVEQSKFETTLEVLFTSTGRVRARNSGLWSPPRRVRLLEAAVTMRVPAPIQYRLITNTGQILASTFSGTTVNVTNLAVTLLPTGWLRAQTLNSGGEDLVIAVRYVEIV
jgi:hypothetical protein